jgi:hypothetical protein
VVDTLLPAVRRLLQLAGHPSRWPDQSVAGESYQK